MRTLLRTFVYEDTYIAVNRHIYASKGGAGRGGAYEDAVAHIRV